MKRKKTRSVASYRAASLKGARTRQQMKDTRTKTLGERMIETIESGEALRVFRNLQTTYRALPNPWFDMVRK